MPFSLKLQRPPLPLFGGRVRYVGSFEELVTESFGNGINALCWERSLTGDFAGVIGQLDAGPGISPLEDGQLRALTLGSSGQRAVEQMLEDQQRLRNLGLAPELNCVNGCERDESEGPVQTDVFSFHADSATVEADTYLCTYHGPSSEGVANEEAVRRVDIPETRAELLSRFGGCDDAAFGEYLSENCFDLHYAPLPGARIFSFGVGNFWRIAVDYPGSPVPPCIHRAPAPFPGDPARLLLIS
jgi:hypothetical protein